MAAWGVLLEMSPGIYNKLNNYNSTKDSLHDTRAHLRELQIESSKGGQIGQVEEGREKCRDAGKDSDQDVELPAVWILLQS